jgi:glycosyltransferase involved in cell wall biosynthesis
MKPIIIRAPFCVRSGYNVLIETVCLELQNNGFDVYPISTNGQIFNDKIKKLCKPIKKELLTSTELCILPIQSDMSEYNTFFRIPKDGKRIFFTMWESTQLPMNVISTLNSGVGVIVPNEWNVINFKIDGISVPIKKCPLFVDTSIFYYKKPTNEIFTFGTGNTDPRKRINEVIKSFCKAFPPSIRDVQLKVKIDYENRSALNKMSDSRIKINSLKLTDVEMASWYHSLDMFVSGTSSEGWGLMQHEAMACGRPLICVKYSGLEEFFNEEVGFPLKYTEVLSEWSWGYSNGFWSKFDEDDLIDRFRWCYKNKQTVEEMGVKSHNNAKIFSKTTFIKNLISIIKEFES